MVDWFEIDLETLNFTKYIYESKVNQSLKFISRQ